MPKLEGPEGLGLDAMSPDNYDYSKGIAMVHKLPGTNEQMGRMWFLPKRTSELGKRLYMMSSFVVTNTGFFTDEPQINLVEATLRRDKRHSASNSRPDHGFGPGTVEELRGAAVHRAVEVLAISEATGQPVQVKRGAETVYDPDFDAAGITSVPIEASQAAATGDYGALGEHLLAVVNYPAALRNELSSAAE